MGVKSIIVLLLSVAAWVSHGTVTQRQFTIVSDALLTCDDTSNNLPTLPFEPQSSPHVVWKPPRVPSTTDNFKYARDFSDAELESLFRSTPGRINEDRQRNSPPTQLTVLPVPLGARDRDIDEILPLDSPFFTDSTSNVNTTAIREFVLSSGIGQCGVVSNWTNLGEFYFPRYYAGVQCEQKSCSVPAGQSCQPNFRADPTFLNVLHWHCCFIRNFNFQPPYQNVCGWRKARFPVLSLCECSCSPVI